MKPYYSSLCFGMAMVSFVLSPCWADGVVEALKAMKPMNDTDYVPAAQAYLRAGGEEARFVEAMEAAAAQDVKSACTWLASYYAGLSQSGGLTQKSEAESYMKKATQFAEKGVKLGDARSKFVAYNLRSMGAQKEAPQTQKLLMEACKDGDFAARTRYLLNTRRLQPDKLDAPEVQGEIKRGNTALMMFIGMTHPDSDVQLKYMEQACEAGEGKAAYMLHSLYSRTDGKKSVEYLKKAVKMHAPESFALLGYMYILSETMGGGEEYGFDTELDQERAVEMMQLGAALADPFACMQLAKYYLRSGKNTQRVKDLFELAGRQDSIGGYAGYAYCLLKGLGCEKDETRAVKMLEDSLNKEASDDACLVLASAYFNGFGVDANMNQSLNYLSEAASLGYNQAYIVMAVLSAQGTTDMPADANRAKIYLNMAKERGEVNAQERFDKLMQQGRWDYFM